MTPDGYLDASWWLDKYKGRRHEVVVPYVKSVEEENHGHTNDMMLWGWLYHNTPLIGIDGQWSRPRRNYQPSPTNIVESQVDSVWAAVARYRPRLIEQTDGAGWELQQHAKWCTRWMEAEFERLHCYRDVGLGFRDGAVFGTGCWEIADDGERPTLDRFLVDEMVVDQRACRTTMPRQYSRRRFLDVDVVIEKYASGDTPEAIELRQKIRDAANKDQMWTWFRRREPYQVVFIESWHFRSGPGAEDGLYYAGVEGADIFEERYDDDEPPHVFFHWIAPLTGFYGRSLAAQLAARQARLNKVDRSIELAIDLVARPMGIVSSVNSHLKEQIENRVGHIHVSRDQQGVVWRTGQPFPPEVIQYRMGLVGEANYTGVSEARMTGSKPRDVDSAAGMKQVEERETGRFAIQTEDLEDVYRKIGNRLIGRQKKLAKAGAKTSNLWRSPDLVRKIAWSKVDPRGENVFIISLGAGSMMSRGPAGRLDDVVMLMQAGLVGKDEGRELYGHPDLQANEDLATAARRRIKRIIDHLIDPDEDEDFDRLMPDATMDLLLGLSLVNDAYQKAWCDGAPDDVLARLRDWMALAATEINKAKALTTQQMQAQAAAAAGPPMMPPAGGALPGPDLAAAPAPMATPPALPM